MQEIKTKRNQRSTRNILLSVALAVFCLYMLVAVINQQIQIRGQQAKLQGINQEISVQEIKNEDVRHELQDESRSSEYIARVARESLNMAKTGERIFVCPGGD